MTLIDLLFVSIVKFSVLAFLLLGACYVAMLFIKQPVERVRLIQISLGAVFLAIGISWLTDQSEWMPRVDLPWLPGHEHAVTDNHLAALPVAGATKPLDVAEPRPPQVADEVAFAANRQRNRGQTSSTYNGPNEIGISSSHLSALAQNPPVIISTTDSSIWTAGKTAFVFAFFGVCIIQIVYLLFGMLLTRRLVSTARPLAGPNRVAIEHLFCKVTKSEHVRLLASSKIKVPIATGIVNPAIVLPEQFTHDGFDRLLVQHSLSHEWKHIERRDMISWQLVCLVQVFLWPQPFYWMLRRELRISQDQLADEFAASFTEEHCCYVETLLQFSNNRHATILGALTMAGNKSNLYRRVEMLLNEKFMIAGISRKSVVLGFTGLMTTICLLLCSIQLTQASTLTKANLTLTEQDEETKAQQKEKGPDRTEEVVTEPETHTGVVLNAATKLPVAGATVTVTRMNSRTWEEIDVTETKTNAIGMYSFTIPVEQANQKYLYLMFDLRHDTYAPRHCGSYSYGMIKKNLKLGDLPWFTKLTMVPGAKISGRVVNGKGEPIADAQIRVSSQAPGGDDPRDFSNQSACDAVSGKDGRFEATVTEEGLAKLSVIPMDHCMKYVDVGSKRGDLGDIALSEGVSIKGQVLDAVGKKMSGLWVNLTETDATNQGSYEMKRSSKTDANGEFQTRPLKPGKYRVQIETKATGALEKKKYANFKDDPPPAAFVRQVIEVTEDSADQPYVLQAVPHIYIRGQCYNSKGEKARCHLPNVFGTFQGQVAWIRPKAGDEKGEFEMIVPHGIERARLEFMTNEHSALTIAFENQQPTTQTRFEYDKIEEDITGIKVTRYVAPILQVKVVDEDGKLVTKAGVGVLYKGRPDPPYSPVNGPKTHVFFEKQTDQLLRSSQLAPNVEFEVYAAKDGLESERITKSMKEGTDEVLTLTLTKSGKKAGGETEMKEDKDKN